jgi:hypothetical protein
MRHPAPRLRLALLTCGLIFVSALFELVVVGVETVGVVTGARTCARAVV